MQVFNVQKVQSLSSNICNNSLYEKLMNKHVLQILKDNLFS